MTELRFSANLGFLWKALTIAERFEWAALPGHAAQALLIEPISLSASPGYFMHDLAMAAQAVDELANDRLRILFDCFHVRELHGADVAGAYHRHAERIGHVQIASWPARAEPGSSHDELDYAHLLPTMQASGYGGAFGCEYHPQTTVEAGLEWRNVICRKVEFAAAT